MLGVFLKASKTQKAVILVKLFLASLPLILQKLSNISQLLLFLLFNIVLGSCHLSRVLLYERFFLFLALSSPQLLSQLLLNSFKTRFAGILKELCNGIFTFWVETAPN